jgi:hypothetical protein
LIIERHTTLQEVDVHWSIDDIADANEALDAWQEAAAEAERRRAARR